MEGGQGRRMKKKRNKQGRTVLCDVFLLTELDGLTTVVGLSCSDAAAHSPPFSCCIFQGPCSFLERVCLWSPVVVPIDRLSLVLPRGPLCLLHCPSASSFVLWFDLRSAPQINAAGCHSFSSAANRHSRDPQNISRVRTCTMGCEDKEEKTPSSFRALLCVFFFFFYIYINL